MQTGNINVQAENIFPIIKKFLYSDHEIFLRELVSNAVDATQKLKTLHKIGEFKGELGDTLIEISVDKKKKTITVEDKGIGMSESEVVKYLNQVAFSGAEEFLNKYKDKAPEAQVIGHFGLGFYSAFMVAEKVTVDTKSFRDEPAVIWQCDGSPAYEIKPSKRKARGTVITLHVAADSDEFLEESRIQSILDKYCKFLPVEIKFGTKKEWKDDPTGEKDKDGNVKRIELEVDNIINNPSPAWIKTPVDLKDEDYKNFYRELYPFTFEDPLFHIHLNVDYPFNLTGILFFPRLSKNKGMQLQRNKIQLYSNQVFITDSVENIVPEFLTLLHGVIDSPDIPLNVSRSYLQSDGNVKKISGHISKKVADKLEEMFKKDREDFEKKWADLSIFIEYGMLTDDKFFDKIKSIYLLESLDGKHYTLDEYQEKIKKEQTDKNEKTVILYSSDPDAQHAYITAANNRNYDVVKLSGPLMSHVVQHIESKIEKISFSRVDADTLDKIIEKTDVAKHNLSEEQEKELKELLEKSIDKNKFTIQLENLSEKDAPMLITQSEWMRRMREQSEVGGGMMAFGQLPENYNLVVNANHPLTSRILIEPDAVKKQQLVKQASDLALLSQGLLKGESLSAFIRRSVDLIN
jgi:molecular chaperone HtpG